MKKHFLIVLLSLIVGAASAQELTSSGYTATISDIKTRSYTRVVSETKHDIEEFIGNCTISKKGVLIKSTTFSTMQIGKNSLVLRIEDEERSGYPLTYDYDTKKFKLARDEYKAKNTKDIDNIILSGILIYAQWLDSDEE